MGWFSSKKKKPAVRAPDADLLAPSNSLQLQTNADEEVIVPDHFKQAAGVAAPSRPNPPMPVRHATLAAGSKEPQSLHIEDDPALGSLDQDLLANNSNPPLPSQRQMLFGHRGIQHSQEYSTRSSPVLTQTVEVQGPRVVNVRDYKKILGTQRELKSTISSLSSQSSSLEKLEYNDEKAFVRLKEQLRVAHNKLLKVDKKLFDTQQW